MLINCLVYKDHKIVKVTKRLDFFIFYNQILLFFFLSHQKNNLQATNQSITISYQNVLYGPFMKKRVYLILFLSPSIAADHKDMSGSSNMEILYILVPSVAIPLAIALLFFFICVCRNNQKSSRPPAPRQPKPVRGQNVEMSMLTTAYKPKVGRLCCVFTETHCFFSFWMHSHKYCMPCRVYCGDKGVETE